MSACVNRLLSLATLSKLMFEQPPSEIICQFVRAPKYSKPLSVMLVHPRKSRWVKLVLRTTGGHLPHPASNTRMETRIEIQMGRVVMSILANDPAQRRRHEARRLEQYRAAAVRWRMVGPLILTHRCCYQSCPIHRGALRMVRRV